MRARWVGLGLCVALTWAAPGFADEPLGADVLFNDAVELMKAGKFPQACPKLVASQRLEPRLGTLFTLAECHAHEGKIASAVARYDEYLHELSRATASAVCNSSSWFAEVIAISCSPRPTLRSR